MTSRQHSQDPDSGGPTVPSGADPESGPALTGDSVEVVGGHTTGALTDPAEPDEETVSIPADAEQVAENLGFQDRKFGLGDAVSRGRPILIAATALIAALLILRATRRRQD